MSELNVGMFWVAAWPRQIFASLHQAFRSKASTSGKSPGTVTLGLGATRETSRTGWPTNSHAAGRP